MCDRERMDAFERAIILAALGEYAVAHPELVAQVDQAEAAVLAIRGCGAAGPGGG